VKPYKRNPKPEAPYYVQFKYQGRRHQLCTNQTDYEEARLAGMRLRVEMAAGICKHAPDGIISIRRIAEIYLSDAVHVQPATRRSNVACLGRVLSNAGFSLDFALIVLNRALVIKYQAAGMDRMTDEERHHAIISKNSAMRQARSLFAKRAMPLYDGITLPDLSGFMRHPLLREPRKEYVPPPKEIIDNIAKAAPILKVTHPGAYAGLLLQLYAGLRPSELIDARWSWVRRDSSGYFIEVPMSASKTDTSRTISISPGIHAELQAVRNSEYLIPGQSDNARWKAIHRKLGPWLRLRGLTGTKTNYELRKLFGSKLATEQGLFAAQRALGHSKPSTTSDYYAALLNRPKALELGSFLATA
jgi:integrase